MAHIPNNRIVGVFFLIKRRTWKHNKTNKCSLCFSCCPFALFHFRECFMFALSLSRVRSRYSSLFVIETYHNIYWQWVCISVKLSKELPIHDNTKTKRFAIGKRFTRSIIWESTVGAFARIWRRKRLVKDNGMNTLYVDVICCSKHDVITNISYRTQNLRAYTWLKKIIIRNKGYTFAKDTVRHYIRWNTDFI